jgi:hypothetical protein
MTLPFHCVLTFICGVLHILPVVKKYYHTIKSCKKKGTKRGSDWTRTTECCVLREGYGQYNQYICRDAALVDNKAAS